MTVTVRVPGALQAFARGAAIVRVQPAGRTVDAALRAVDAMHPGVVDRILTETGQLREHVNVFVGEENCRFIGGLSAPVADGDTIEIVASVSGG